MKLKKPFNQLTTIFPYTPSWNRYTFLSLVITALLFCGNNSQIIAAAMPIGANTVAACVTSEDKLNADSFLKSSPPDADNRQWTTMEKIGAFVGGIASLVVLSYGGYRAHEYFYPGEIENSGRDVEDITRTISQENDQGERNGDNGLIVSKDSSPSLSHVEEKIEYSVNVEPENLIEEVPTTVNSGNQSTSELSPSIVDWIRRCCTTFRNNAWLIVHSFRHSQKADHTTVVRNDFLEDLLSGINPESINTSHVPTTKIILENPEKREENIRFLKDLVCNTDDIEEIVNRLNLDNKALAMEAVEKYANCNFVADSAHRPMGQKQFAYFLVKNQYDLGINEEWLKKLNRALQQKALSEDHQPVSINEDNEKAKQQLVETLSQKVTELWTRDFPLHHEIKENEGGTAESPLSNNEI